MDPMKPMQPKRATSPVVPIEDASRRRVMKQAVLANGVFSASMAWAAGLARAEPSSSAGYGKDPSLKAAQVPWLRVLTTLERAILSQAADTLIPTDAFGPGAAALGVVDFLDEWLSAPYSVQREDLLLIRQGLAARQRGGADLPSGQALAVPEDQDAVWSASALRLRVLVIIGWGTKPEAAIQLGFVGNEPRGRFDGPPAEVLTRLLVRAQAGGSGSNSCGDGTLVGGRAGL
jgi:hypothetical protein